MAIEGWVSDADPQPVPGANSLGLVGTPDLSIYPNPSEPVEMQAVSAPVEDSTGAVVASFAIEGIP